MRLKTNDYTGLEYDCHCEGPYICIECRRVRDEFMYRQWMEDRDEWLINAVLEIAKKLDILLPNQPKKPE